MRKQIARLLVIVFLFTGVPLAETAESTVVSAAQNRLPSAVSLLGTKHLAPEDNQGVVGCCASESAAYLQFSNAVSRYLHAQNPDIDWDPSSGNKSNLFSPKFTYTLAGSSTERVYEILRDHGCATLEQSTFYKEYMGNGKYAGYQYRDDDKNLIPSSVSWDLTGATGWDALQYRLKNYEEIWITKAPYISTETPTVNGIENIQFTTSDAGQALLEKIKDALNRGNVVITCGYPDQWKYGQMTDVGTYGTAGDLAIVASTKVEEDALEAHEVSIIGYDDDFTATYHGVTMKGAFLIQNSYGLHIQRTWMMYDAVNTVSEYPQLREYSADRVWTVCNFSFTYWDRDIVALERPERMLQVNIKAADREAPYVVLTMRDNETGKTSEHVPAVFVTDATPHPNYETYDWANDNTRWLNFDGIENGPVQQKTFYFSYQTLIDLIPEGKTFSDYTFGAKFAATREATVEYSNISLITDTKESLQAKNSVISCVSTALKGKTYGGSVAFGDVKRFTVTAQNSQGTFFNCPTESVEYGDTFTFSLSVARGYSADNAVVKVNGTVVTPNGGKYTVENVTENLTLSVEGITATTLQKTQINFYVGSTLYASKSYTPGETITLPTAPTKQGYTFIGWEADLYEQAFSCIDVPFPETMPGCSFNAYAVFEKTKTTKTLGGGRYASGMENYQGKTVLLFFLYAAPSVFQDFWKNRQQYDWTLHYTWEESGTTYSMEQSNIAPESIYEFDTCCFFRFAICEQQVPFIPKKDQVYKVSMTVETDEFIYEISGARDGYFMTEDPICRTEGPKTFAPKHFFTNGNDFEYWSNKTYMTLEFTRIASTLSEGNLLWVLSVTDQNGEVHDYSGIPNSFYVFSEHDALVRFPILEFGWVPQYGGVYQIDFSVFNGNQQVYTGSLSDVKCNYRYPVTWEIDGKTKTIDCPIGKMPVYDGATIYEIETGWYEHITWISAPKPATAPARYVSLGANRTNDYTITFRTEDGIVSQKEYPSGFKIAMPENPVKKGYTFLGWTPKVISTATANRIYTAQFIPEIGDWDANSERTDDGTQYQLLYDRRRISVSSHPEDGSLVASRINTTSNRNSYFGAFTKSTYPILSGKYMLSQDFETEDGFASFGLSAEAESENLFGDAGNNRFVLYRSVSEGVTTFYVVIAGEKKPCCKMNATTGARMWTVGVTKQNGSYYMTVDGVAVTGSGYSEQVQSACKLENRFAEEFLGNNYSVHFLMYADCMNGDAYLHPSVTVDDNLILDVQNRCTDRNLGFDGTVEYNVPNYSLSTDGNRHIYRFEVPSAGSVTVTEPVNPKGFSIQASMAQSPGGKTVKYIFSNDPTFLSGNQISVDVYRYIRYYEGAVTLYFAQEDEITKLHISMPQGSVAIPPLDFSSLTGAPIYLKITGGAGSEPTVTLSNTTSVFPAYTTAAALAAMTQNFLAAEAVAKAQALDGFVCEIYADATNWWVYQTQIHVAVAISKSYTDRQKAALTATAELTELEAYIQSLETADATGIAGCRKGLLGFSYGDKNYDYYHDGVLDIRDLVRLKKIALMMYYVPIDDELPLDWD